MSYRLNVPSADESTTLLTVDDWERVLARPPPAHEGRPIVGLDLGGGRAWSAAVAMWQNGRVEAVAIAPGLPDIELQEKRDRVPRGAYGRLVAAGILRIATGLRVPPVKQLVDAVRPWAPRLIICDRFDLNRLKDEGTRRADHRPRDPLERSNGGHCGASPFRGRWSDGGRPDFGAADRGELGSLGSKERRSGLYPDREARPREQHGPRRCGGCAHLGGRRRLSPAGNSAHDVPWGRVSRRHIRLSGKRWQRTRWEVFERDGYRCVRCGKAGRLECDHIVPLELDPDQDPYDADGCQAALPGLSHRKDRGPEQAAGPRPRALEGLARLADIGDNLAG